MSRDKYAGLRRQMHQLLAAKAVVDKYGAAAREYAALEETQDIPGRTVAGEYRTNGVFRIDRSAGYECHRYAPELSERFPSIPIRMTERQAE